MKGGIVVFYMAIKTLQALSLLDQDIEINLILNSDEEAGSGTSKDFSLEKAKTAKACLDTEPGFLSVGSIKAQRYGRAVYKVEAHGIAGHAGNHPDRAVSPIVELSHQIQKLHTLNDFEAGLTISPVSLHSGESGSLAMIPEKAYMYLDVRFSTQELSDKITTIIQNLKPVQEGTRLEITGGLEKPPLELTERNAVLLEEAKSIAAELGFEIEPITCGGGSDGNFTSPVCATLDGIGLNGDLLHNPGEYVRTDTIPQRVTLVAELIRRLAKGDD
jgi:glutamate carboxypeptidase